MTGEAARRAPVILIVEDEPMLRELAVELVESDGFVAIEAGDAEQALALLENRPDIAVLFTDVKMPGTTDGLKLARAVRRRWPAIEILVASGHVRLDPSDLPPSSVFLGKPYSGKALISGLRSLIAGNQARLASSVAGEL